MIRWHHQTLYHLHHFMLRLRQHQAWLYSFVLLSSLLTLLNKSLGNLKPIATWSWLDIVGEGATALFIAVWLFIMLASRTRGRTTTLLGLGLLMLYIANFQDLLDEFIQLPAQAFPWDSLIESLPLGLILLTAGMIYWYREQQVIHAYLAQRSSAFENNHKVNRETGLAPINVMLGELKQKISRSSTSVQLNLLHIRPADPEQTLSEQAAFKRYCADTLINNLPDQAKVYHLTCDHYAIITEASSIKNQALMTPLMQTLRSLRYYSEALPYELQLSWVPHCLNDVKAIEEVESLVMDCVKRQAQVRHTLQPQQSIG